MGYIETLRQKIGHDEHIGVGAGIFLCQNGMILLQKRRDNGCWTLHSGGMEIGETLEEAAKRELREETGLVAGKLTLLGAFSGPDMRYTYPNGDKVCVVLIAYICEEFSGTLAPEPEEVAQLQWFPVTELPDNISPPDKRAFCALKQYLTDKNAALTAGAARGNATTP